VTEAQYTTSKSGDQSVTKRERTGPQAKKKKRGAKNRAPGLDETENKMVGGEKAWQAYVGEREQAETLHKLPKTQGPARTPKKPDKIGTQNCLIFENKAKWAVGEKGKTGPCSTKELGLHLLV